MRIICRVKASYSADDGMARKAAGLADVLHVKGYRVRLRVVEEYDVALLADSPADAKARAEAEVREGGEFEAIQDSWPEEIVSVEALAVEPYPDLE
jgi:hypothetical protein